eukprot:16449433-Heterocapsa_arctica.AAC.1
MPVAVGDRFINRRSEGKVSGRGVATYGIASFANHLAQSRAGLSAHLQYCRSTRLSAGFLGLACC